MLWLSEEVVSQLLEPKEVLPAVESAFLEHGLGRVQMPSKIYLDFPTSGGDLRTMPAYIKELNMAGVKVVNSHPGNPKRGLPTVMATLILNDPETGAPLALISATALTDARTGAAGSVAARALARQDSRRVGLLGCGRQARTQLKYLGVNFPMEDVFVFGKNSAQVQSFCLEMKRSFTARFHPCQSLSDVLDVDILVTTTPSRTPVVFAEGIPPGIHINAIGADAQGKQELDSKILQRALVYVDDREQAAHSGEVNVPLREGQLKSSQIRGTLGEVLAKKIRGREQKQDVTVFDSTGLAIQDIAVGEMILKKAKEKGMGQRLN